MQTKTQFVFRQFLKDRHFISLSVNTFLQKICFACQQTNNKIMCHICKMRERNNQELASKCCKKITIIKCLRSPTSAELTRTPRARSLAFAALTARYLHSWSHYTGILPSSAAERPPKGHDGHSSRWQWDSWWRVKSTEAPYWVRAPCRSAHDPRRQAGHERGRGQMDSSLNSSSQIHTHHRGRLSLWVR